MNVSDLLSVLAGYGCQDFGVSRMCQLEQRCDANADLVCDVADLLLVLARFGATAVSYTHLTLPTILRV